MVSFKYKPNKLKHLSNVRTLDEIHRDHMASFDRKKQMLPELKKQLNKNRNKLKKLENNISNVSSPNEIKQRAVLKDDIHNLEYEINKISSNVDMLDYISKAGDILIDYYDITSGTYYGKEVVNDEIVNTSEMDKSNIVESVISEEQNMSTEMVEESVSNNLDDSNMDQSNNTNEPNNDSNEQNNDSNEQNNDSNDPNILQNEDSKNNSNLNISDTLKILNQISQKSRKVKKPVKKRKITQHVPTMNRSIFKFIPIEQEETEKVDVTNIIDRATLQDKYLMLVDKQYACDKIKSKKTNICSTCNIEKILFQSEGCYTCLKCGEVEPIIIESEIPNHKDMINEKQKYPYKKINHFKEKLNQFQSKETAENLDEVCSIIENDLKKQRVNNTDVTPQLIKQILRKHRMMEHSEHLQQLYCKISGNHPVTLSREVEETLISMFQNMLDSFHTHCPEERVNFLNYSYVLNKLFRILGMNDHARYFNLLKSRDKLREQDQIWIKICRDMSWPFFPSL